MSAFGPAHLAWIAAIAFAAWWIPRLCRTGRIPPRPLRAALALLLAGCEIQRYLHDGIQWPHGLPLQPCSLTAWLAVFTCITLSPLAAEYVYFVGLAGAGMAVITPDMGAQWPVRFFVTHGVLIVTACVLAFGDLAPWRPEGVWWAWVLFLSNALLMVVFDLMAGANYWYLRSRPGVVTVYNWMGPWPVYWVTAEVFALAVFRAIELPWKRHARARYAAARPLLT